MKTIKTDFIQARTVLFRVDYYFVWATKHLHPVLTGEDAKELRQIFFDIAQDKDFIIKDAQIMPDHVHVFASAHPKIPAGYIYKMLKGISARKLLVQFPGLTDKLWKGQLWENSTYVETIGQISGDAVQEYLEKQKKK